MQLEDVTLIFAIIFVFLGALGQSSPLSALESTKCSTEVAAYAGWLRAREERNRQHGSMLQSKHLRCTYKTPWWHEGRSGQRIFPSSQQDSVLRWRTWPMLNTRGTVLESALQADQSMEKHEAKEIIPFCHQNIALLTVYIFKLFWKSTLSHFREFSSTKRVLSLNLTKELSLKRRFSGLRSLCAMFSEWQCCKAKAIWKRAQ